jgi:hypothetical protein
VKPEQYAAFLDELTMLSRRYGLIVEGDRDDNLALRVLPHLDVNAGRYEVVEGTTSFRFEMHAELENIIKFDEL